MTTGAYEDAIKAFDNADSIKFTTESSFQKARCYIATNCLNEATGWLAKSLEFCPNDTLLSVDLQICNSLCQLRDLSSDPSEVLQVLEDCIKLYESGKLKHIKMQDAPLTIKLIPNADRCTLERDLITSGEKINLKAQREYAK